MYLYILLFFLSVILYYSSYLNETYHIISNNYNRLKLLKNTAPGIKINVYTLLKESTKACFTLMFLYISQNWEKTIKNIGFNHYEITYVIKGKVYKFRVRPTKLPRILQVIDEKDEDVTDKLSAYFGPDENFHGKVYRPKDFKYKELTFNMADGNIYEFEEEDDIILKNR
jgi:hypothetical protein